MNTVKISRRTLADASLVARPDSSVSTMFAWISTPAISPPPPVRKRLLYGVVCTSFMPWKSPPIITTLPRSACTEGSFSASAASTFDSGTRGIVPGGPA